MKDEPNDAFKIKVHELVKRLEPKNKENNSLWNFINDVCKDKNDNEDKTIANRSKMVKDSFNKAVNANNNVLKRLNDGSDKP